MVHLTILKVGGRDTKKNLDYKYTKINTYRERGISTEKINSLLKLSKSVRKLNY